jgi:predicted house-cleaning noncanonical NTP pyrophosphatase (MazG superfamily)
MRKEYHKLVRDVVPEIIRSKGQKCEVAVMAEDEYRQALREKLVEEATEASETTTIEDLNTELADLHEVLDALMLTYGIQLETIKKEQKRRRRERGGFEQRFRLLWVE